MKLAECKEAYYLFSGKLSDNCRKLAFAGIAVVWIFKKEDGGNYVLPATMAWATCFIIVSLALDPLQYAYQALAWGCYHRRQELKDHDPQREFLAPRTINWFPVIAIGAKAACVATAYVFIFIFMFSRFEFS